MSYSTDVSTNAIRKAYPNVTLIDDKLGAFDKDGKSITLRAKQDRCCTNHT